MSEFTTKAQRTQRKDVFLGALCPFARLRLLGMVR